MLITICAQRYGMLPWTYAHVASDAQFSCDIMAWMATWTVPVQAFLGGGKKKRAADDNLPRNADRDAVLDAIPRDKSWIKAGRADATRFVDIDKLNRPETVHHIAAMMGATFPVATDATVKSFEDKIRARAAKIDIARAKP